MERGDPWRTKSSKKMAHSYVYEFVIQQHFYIILNKRMPYLLFAPDQVGVIMDLYSGIAIATINILSIFSMELEERIIASSCLGMNMPRVSTVPQEDRINVVKKFMENFVTNELPSYTSQVWRDMSKELGNRWTPHNVYINVREDRCQILTIARNELGIVGLNVNNNNAPTPDTTTINDTISSNPADETLSHDAKNTNKRMKNHEEINTTEFDLVLTEEEWNSIKPEGNILYGNRQKEILQRGIWTNLISIAFWKQHKTNCAFVYKRANVKSSADGRTYFVDIYGKCKSATCGNTFIGHGEKNQDQQGFIIRVNTRDTSSQMHDEVKRPLNGQRRIQAAQEMIQEGCAVWKRRQAREHMQYGDLEPPFLPNGDVMRQAKKERIHDNLNVKPGDSRDLIRTVENIQADPEYGDLIHAVGSLPFYTFYGTPAQLDAYKQYVRLNKSKSSICVDATGSLIRTLDRPGNMKTGHIFLYSVVINFEKTTQPVHQMLSEKHETEFITFWFKQWLRQGAPPPKEAVSDYSRALISALCLAFNNRPIKSYLDIWFAILENPRTEIERPATIIRIDVAHLIHMVCRWKCFEKANQWCIKQFFVRCVAVMVECETLSSFRKVFTLTCAVGFQQFEDSELELPDIKTTKDARKKLEGYIACRGIEDKLKQHTPREDVDYEAGPFEFEASDDKNTLNDDTRAGHRLVKWVEQQKQNAEKCLRKGQDPNAFYLPDFVERLLKLAKEFPLWTAVVVPFGSPHATSSYVESYFNDIKNRVFANVARPVRVDLFLKSVARNIIGETNLFASKIIKAEMAETNRRQAELQTPEMNKECEKVDTRQIDQEKTKHAEYLSQSVSCGNVHAAVLVPKVDSATMEELTFVDNVSDFVETTPLIPNVATLNDSDLFSVENWRGKGLGNKGVDNLADNGADYDDQDLQTNGEYPLMPEDCVLPEISINDSYFMDHSNSQLNASHSLMASSAIAATEELDSVNSKSHINGLEQSSESDKLQLDLETFHYLADKKLSECPNDSEGIDGEAFDEGKIVSSSSQPGEHATMEFEKLQTANKSKYFRDYPEIRQINLHTTKLKRPYLLQNGSHCPQGVKIDGDRIFIRNTCPFDSVVHILMASAIDNLQYAEYLKQSQNITLKFVSDFLNSGVTNKILEERVRILRSFYKPTSAGKTIDRVLSYYVNSWDSIENIVKYTMASEPSVHKRDECSQCEGRTYSSPSIALNHNIIAKRGFRALQAALAFKPFVNGLKCGCGGIFTLFSEPHVHLFIDLDIRGTVSGHADEPEDSRMRSASGLRGKLQEMPLVLDLRARKTGQKKGYATVRYSLAGVVGFVPGHFIAYSRRANGNWQMYNDMDKNIVNNYSPNTEIEPHLAIYIRQNQDEMV